MIWLEAESVGETGAPERIRTSDLCLRRAALYPAGLRDFVPSVSKKTPVFNVFTLEGF